MRIAAVVGLATALVGVGPAQGATDPRDREPLPVPEQFFAGAVQGITAPGTPLAGTNDDSCRPSPEKPRPVVLLHGTFGGAATNWVTLGPRLHNEGFCTFTLTYGGIPGAPVPFDQIGGTADIRAVSVPQVAEFVDHVLEVTGAEQVDLVGHSQGTLVAAYVAKHARPGRVGAVVSLAPLWHGTGGALTARFWETAPGGRGSLEAASPTFIEQMLPGSRFLADLWEGGTPYAPGVRYTNIVTRYDGIVHPYTSGLEPGPGVTEITVQDGCEQDLVEHVSITSGPRSTDMVVAALDPDTPRTPRCVAVAPLVGATGS